MFAGYGSDSEGEVAVKQVVAVKTETAPASAPAPVQRNVKRLDISFLPPEIQAALTRGDSTRDSDDDEPVSTAKTSSSRSASRATDSAGDTKSKLLSMLPAPKVREEDNSMKPKQTNPTNSDSTKTSNPPAASTAPKSKFVFGFSSTETTRKAVSIETVITAQISTATQAEPAHLAEGDEEEEEDLTVLPWLQSTKQKAPATKERAVPFAVAAAPTKVPSQLSKPSYTSLHPAGFLPAQGPTEPPAQPAVQQQSYADYLRQQEEAEEDALQQEMPAHKRRKGRDMELQLLAGDLSGIQNSSAVQDISTQHQWNEMRYTEQQEREREVQRGFGIGMNKMLTQVSKQQNRKHQLSSLAMKAAETELAMLDKRGARNLTKSETQGKYAERIASLEAEIAGYVAERNTSNDKIERKELLDTITAARNVLKNLLDQQNAGMTGLMAFPALAPADVEVYVKFGKHSDAELLAVPSVQVAQILISAQESFHSEGGILLREVQPGNFVRCTKERVPNNCVLSFEPKFYNAKFKYKTLSRAKSLRLLAKQAAKTIGKVGGIASRVSGLFVEVEVHGVESARIEGFVEELQKCIVIEGDVARWIDYGVLHGRFVVAPYSEGMARFDYEDSYEHEDGVPSEASLEYYS